MEILALLVHPFGDEVDGIYSKSEDVEQGKLQKVERRVA